MDSRQLRYFAAVHEEGSLSHAARRLRVAASAVSLSLANLEDELGAPLFIRKPRGMQPTAAGERLYGHASAILRAMEAAEQDMRHEGREIAGDLTVGMAHSAVKAIGVALMRRVMEDHPRLRLSISESLSGSTLLHLMASEVDLAMVYNPPADPSLRLTPVLEEKMVCVGRPEIIGADPGPISFDELLELPVILLRQGVSARALMDDEALLKRLEARARVQINSVNAISGALQAGLGCAIATRLFMRDQIDSGALHARAIIGPELSRTLYICERADRPATFALQAMRAILIALTLDAIQGGVWDAAAHPAALAMTA